MEDQQPLNPAPPKDELTKALEHLRRHDEWQVLCDEVVSMREACLINLTEAGHTRDDDSKIIGELNSYTNLLFLLRE